MAVSLSYALSLVMLVLLSNSYRQCMMDISLLASRSYRVLRMIMISLGLVFLSMRRRRVLSIFVILPTVILLLGRLLALRPLLAVKGKCKEIFHFCHPFRYCTLIVQV